MSSIQFNNTQVALAILGYSCLFASKVIATPADTIQQIQQYSDEQKLNQVTDVNQLRDVSPGDWAYEALRSLVNRYGCIVGYPNLTYRGNRALSRYEFAAGLNSCINVMERLIANSEAVLREDIDKLKRLVSEFEAELATLGARVDDLEGRVAFLEDHQFSTTTKLEGEVIFALGSILSGDRIEGNDVDKNPVFGDRVRLELNTSFTGEDLLFTRLSTGNFPEFSQETGTFAGETGFAQPDDNDLALEVLFYSFNLGDDTQIIVGPAGVAADDIAYTVNVLDGDGGSGAISLFGTRNPIYFTPGEAGIGFIRQFGDNFEFSAGYLAGDANNPEEKNGLFNGSYSALAQLLYKPNDEFNLAFTYIHGYNQSDTGTGSNLANFRSFTGETIPTSSNAYGIEFSWAVSKNFVVGGWGAYTNVNVVSGKSACSITGG